LVPTSVITTNTERNLSLEKDSPNRRPVQQRGHLTARGRFSADFIINIAEYSSWQGQLSRRDGSAKSDTCENTEYQKPERANRKGREQSRNANHSKR